MVLNSRRTEKHAAQNSVSFMLTDHRLRLRGPGDLFSEETLWFMGEREANGIWVCQALLELEASIGYWGPPSLLPLPLPGCGLPH